MDNQMREFIENELAKTYEYQLGLALQRACERFWYGGFLAFPFAYAKIRTQKGKTLMRMDSIVWFSANLIRSILHHKWRTFF